MMELLKTRVKGVKIVSVGLLAILLGFAPSVWSGDEWGQWEGAVPELEQITGEEVGINREDYSEITFLSAERFREMLKLAGAGEIDIQEQSGLYVLGNAVPPNIQELLDELELELKVPDLLFNDDGDRVLGLLIAQKYKFLEQHSEDKFRCIYNQGLILFGEAGSQNSYSAGEAVASNCENVYPGLYRIQAYDFITNWHSKMGSFSVYYKEYWTGTYNLSTGDLVFKWCWWKRVNEKFCHKYVY